MRKIILFVFGALLTGLISCSDDEVAFNSAADVFVAVKTIGTGAEIDTVYGIALHVFGNKPMQTVTASLASDPDVSYTLQAYDGYPYDFYFETDEDEFSTTMPEMDDYLFNVLAQSGETATLSDELLDDMIYPTDDLMGVYNADDNEMQLSWTEIDDADYLVVKMFDDGGDLVFNSPAMNGSLEEYDFSATTSGWISDESPVDGDDYVIELDAYSFEPGQSDLNLQAKTINFQNVTWGE